MNAYEHVVFDLASACTNRIVNRVIRNFQRVAITMAGDDSGLANAWDDICVQVQQEHSSYWEACEEMVELALQVELSNVNRYELEALWLESPEGTDWSCTAEAETSRATLLVSDVVTGLKTELYARARDWSNKRIRTYLHSSQSDA